MACCPCFKSQIQDDRDESSRRKSSQHKSSIRKDRDENDLLALNEKGMLGRDGSGNGWSDPKVGGGSGDLDDATRLKAS